MWKRRNQQRKLDLRRRRRGIVVSIELMLGLPLVIILLCAVGASNKAVALELGVCQATVGKRRQRLVERRA